MTMAADTNATERLSRTVASWHDRAHALVVQDQASYEGAAVLLREIKSLRGEIELTFGPITAKARAAWKESLAQRKRHEAPLEIAEGTIKRAMATFIQVEERRVRDEAARLEREAREEDARRRAEERAAEETTRLAEAEALEAAGMGHEALAVLAAPMPEPDPIPPPPPPPPTIARPTASGISTPTTWHAEVTDLRELVLAIAAGKAPLTLVEASATALGQYARATKGSVSVPGVRFFGRVGISSRAS